MEFEGQSARYLAQCEAALQNVVQRVFQPSSVVSEAAAYSLLNGGKRVRGVLTLAVCDMLHGDGNAAAAFAAAIEMIHAFSLIHDDLPCMDDDDMRRGQPSAHIRYGEANALLAGDLLALEAPRVIAEAAAPADHRLAAIRCLLQAAGARGMLYGQELDLAYEQKPADQEALLRIHRHKTGALIEAAAQLGVAAAGQDSAGAAPVLQFAQNIGLTFQIVDDMLDVTSSPEVLGKPVGSDAKSGKNTFVTVFGLEQARREVYRLTAQGQQALADAYGERADFLGWYAAKLADRVS